MMALTKSTTTRSTTVWSVVVAFLVLAMICSTLRSCHARIGMRDISLFQIHKFVNALVNPLRKVYTNVKIALKMLFKNYFNVHRKNVYHVLKNDEIV